MATLTTYYYAEIAMVWYSPMIPMLSQYDVFGAVSWNIVVDSYSVRLDNVTRQFDDSFQSSWLDRIVPFDWPRYIYVDNIQYQSR
jgi:hypothetical protein